MFKLILEKSFVKDRNTTDKDLLLPFFLETTNNLHYNNANVLFVYKDKIWRFDYDNDLKKTMRLAKIIELNGIKKTSFTYTEIVPGQYYSSADAEVYPYKELQKLPKTYSLSSASVVSYLGILKQDYAYSGFTIHSQGLGYIGFKKKFTTNWYDVNNPKKIWSVIETSPQLMGQVIAQWSFGDTITNPLGHPYYSSPPLTNGSNSPSFTAANTSKDLSCVTYNYAVNFNQFGRGIKSILPITVTAYDFLTNSKTITYNQYDNYNNLIYIRTSNSLGYKSTTYSLTNNTTGIGNEYFVGRLVKTIDTMAFYNDLYSTQDQYFYNNGLLVNSIKSYNNNPQTIATSMAYDAVGNITSSTTTVGTKSRTSTTVYDANYRLTISKTDIEGKTTTYINNDLGQQLSVTNYLGQTQTNTYNRWGKVISITNNAHETTIETKIKFERFVSGDLNVETSDNIGNYKLESFDIAGNLMKTKSKGFLTNSFREQINQYDVLGMKTKASEPYFLEYSRNIKLKDEQTGGFVIDPETGKIVTEKQIIVPATPNEDKLWTTYIYDYLNRPICTNLPNGKIITNTFNGLVSTGFDGVKTSEQWLDVNGNKTKIIDNGQTIFYFYNANGTIKNTNYNGHCVSFTYDDWGRKTSQLDSSVNYKPYRYAYNEWGEQIAEYTPNNDSTIITYNIYGKVLQKTSIGINTNSNIIYSYNDNLFLIEESGTIYSGTFPSKYTKSYLYDTKNRLIKTTETTPFIVTENNLTYDIYGRLNTKNINAYFVKFNNYTNGNKTIKYSYSSWNGMNTVIQDNNSLDTLWVMRNTNQNMQLTSGEYGNGIKLNYTYNNLGMPLELNEFSTNQNFINLSYTYDLPRGLTLSRKNHVVNIEENFLYDIEERLIEWSSSNGTEHQTYTADGRIHTSSAVGTYSYNSPTRYNLGGFNLTQSANDYINSRAQRNITYNMFQDPVRLEENTILTFQYNLKNQRSFVEYKDYSKFKIYSEDAQVEVIETSKADGLYVKFITYMDGDAYTADFVYVKEMIFNTNVVNFEGYYYLHRDNQGTILAISNANGDLVESRYFDCWGQLKSGTINFIERGYTGHDHFQEVALIHMNGRLYDPFIRMFLQYDNYIQDASNPQDYNRFGYCLNNPLKYTDPSGELLDPISFSLIFGAVISGFFYSVQALSNDNFSWEGLGQSLLIGGITGFATAGIGAAFGGVSNVFNEIARAVVHGASGSYLNLVFSQGSTNFGSDFLSGAVASLVGSGISAAFTNAGATQLVSLYVGSALSGGITAQLTGGDFLQGASRGLIIAALNHSLETLSNQPQFQNKNLQKQLNERLKKMFPNLSKYKKLRLNGIVADDIDRRFIPVENGNAGAITNAKFFIDKFYNMFSLATKQTIIVAKYTILEASDIEFAGIITHELGHVESNFYINDIRILKNPKISEFGAYLKEANYYIKNGYSYFGILSLFNYYKLYPKQPEFKITHEFIKLNY